MADLWPTDIAVQQVRAPVALLREQAALLAAKTNGLVTASVGDVEGYQSIREKYGPFSFGFLIVGPALGGYRYRLFDITYSESLYPVRLYLDTSIAQELGADPKKPVMAQTEAELQETLTKIFTSTKTRQVVQAIVAQSAALK